MVVLKPMFEGERTRVCRCGHMGLASPIRERNSFDRCLCVWCRRRRFNAAYARRVAARTKAEQAEARAMSREYSRKRRNTPEGRAKENAAARRYGARVRADPERVARRNARARARYRALKAASPTTPQHPLKGRITKIRRPIEPFRDWLWYLIETAAADEQNPYEAVAARLGISPRTLSRYLHEFETVDEGVVDWAATQAGNATVEEIYAGLYTRPVRRVHTRRQCATPPCANPVDGTRFCPDCTQRLAAIRAALEAEKRVYTTTTHYTCRNPACSARRPPRANYCAECVDEGWGQDDE